MKSRRRCQKELEQQQKTAKISQKSENSDINQQNTTNIKSKMKFSKSQEFDDASSPNPLSDSHEQYEVDFGDVSKSNVLIPSEAKLKSCETLSSRLKPIKKLDKSKRTRFIKKASNYSKESQSLSVCKQENSEIRASFNQIKHGPNELIDTWSDVSQTMVGSLVFQRSEIEGWGVRSTTFIPRNTIVAEYIGEIIRPIVAEKRQLCHEKNGNFGTYVFKLDNSNYLDATNRGGIARFINHSCEPNCRSELVTMSNGRKAVVIIADQNIPANTELTYDYKLPFETQEKAIPCLCGSKNCRHFLNWGEDLTKEVLPLKNIPEKTLCTLLEHDILPASMFKMEADIAKSKSK